jgi:Holliday junction resolvasome RuvABC endonuclease subunit
MGTLRKQVDKHKFTNVMGKLKKKIAKHELTRILAIDPSPRGTAIVLFEGKRIIDYWFTTEVISITKKYDKAILVPKVQRNDESTRMERILIQRNLIKTIVEKYNPDYIALEDYVWKAGPKSGGVIQISELGGVIRLWFYEHYYKVRTYDPKSVKLAWTSKGDASKADMIDRGKTYLENKCPEYHKQLHKLADKYLEGICDAIAIGNLLRVELLFRQGKIQLSELPEHYVRVFNRVTDSMPVCLIDRPFLEREKEN